MSTGRNDCEASCRGTSLDGASCPWGELSAESVPVACEAVSVAGGAVLVNGKAVPVSGEAILWLLLVKLFIS